MSVEYTCLKFRGTGSFGGDWQGLDGVKPINVLIGRNNTGKSALLKLIERTCCNHGQCNLEVLLGAKCGNAKLQEVFTEGMTQLDGRNDDWRSHGAHFAPLSANWQLDASSTTPKEAVFSPDPMEVQREHGWSEAIYRSRREKLTRVIQSIQMPFCGQFYIPLSAERDIVPEKPVDYPTLSANGAGATSFVDCFLHNEFPPFNETEVIRDHVQVYFADICRPDYDIRELSTRNIKNGDEILKEIYFREEGKGQIALSNSGSGFKTVLLVLLNLHVLPRFRHKDPGECVFAFEELENFLHPSLLRRLLQHITDFITKTGATLFISTHSPVVLDYFARLRDTQILHVSHSGKHTEVKTLDSHLLKRSALADIGARPSDLLQSNGIVWVEGPSDRIYVRRWVEILAGNELVEGVHYQCVCYGGSLLNYYSALDPELTDLIAIMKVNPNLAIICDSDKTADTDDLKPAVQRVLAEAAEVERSCCWVTAGRTIENYVPVEAYNIDSIESVRKPTQFEQVIGDGSSFAKEYIKPSSISKVEFALRTSPLLTYELMAGQYDWLEKAEELVSAIRCWNQ